MKSDLHLHSFTSGDSLLTGEGILRGCRQKNIEAVAITDHNEVWGALRLQQDLPLKVVVGEEITTQKGEIIGLFLKKKIQPGLTLPETIKQIREQEGIVYLPHPFDRSTGRKSLKLVDILPLIDQIDLVEAFNSRTFLSFYNRLAFQFAQKYQKPVVAGSDAHTAGEIGSAGIEVDVFQGQDDFMSKVSGASIFGRRASPHVYLASRWARLKKKFSGTNR